MTGNPVRDEGMAEAFRALRSRRGLLWGSILIYLPAIWLSLELTGSDRATSVVFVAWLALVSVALFRAVSARCPRCGKTFHLNGFIPLYLRRCLHCGMHINADRRPDENDPSA